MSTATAPPVKPVEKTKNQQIIMAAKEQQPIQQMPAGDAAREYLLEAGWVEQSRNDKGESFWADPAATGSKGRMEQTVNLPGKDGTDPVVVQQFVAPPTPWNYPLHEAMNIQRQRDLASPAKE